jgi:hypothetical protein
MESAETVSLERRKMDAQKAADAVLYLDQLLFSTTTKSASTITVTPAWLSMFDPFAELSFADDSQSQATEREGLETDFTLASGETNRRSEEIVKIFTAATRRPQVIDYKESTNIRGQERSSQMITKPLSQDIQDHVEDNDNAHFDQDRGRRGSTVVPLVTEAVSQAEDDLSMSVHSGLGLFSEFSVSASDIILFILVSTLFIFLGKNSTTEDPPEIASLFSLASVIPGSFAHLLRQHETK